jgi:hypothetical protein
LDEVQQSNPVDPLTPKNCTDFRALKEVLEQSKSSISTNTHKTETGTANTQISEPSRRSWNSPRAASPPTPIKLKPELQIHRFQSPQGGPGTVQEQHLHQHP